MTETIYRTKARYTREEITSVTVTLPEYAWMTPIESFIGSYLVRQVGSPMANVLNPSQFDDMYETEDAIVESVQSAKPPVQVATQ